MSKSVRITGISPPPRMRGATTALRAASLRVMTLRAAALVMALVLSGCGEGFETTTRKGHGVKEWHLRLEGGKIEAVAVWPPGRGPWPALLLIHAGRGRAQRFSRELFRLSRRGLLAMSISLPGFGDSTGPEDFAGPRSVGAVLQAMEYLASRKDVSPDGIAIYGFGQGATVALLAAIRDPRIRLVALESGVYDLGGAFNTLPPTTRERLRSIMGGSAREKPLAYRARSPKFEADKVRGPILIMHSKGSRMFPVTESEGLAAKLRGAGRPFRFVMTRGRLQEFLLGHPSIRRWVVPFIGDYMTLKTPGSPKNR